MAPAIRGETLLAALTLSTLLATAFSSGDDVPATPQTTELQPTAGSDSTTSTTVGVATIELVTPESGGGRRPVLEWRPVDGAVGYQVELLTPSGGPY